MNLVLASILPDLSGVPQDLASTAVNDVAKAAAQCPDLLTAGQNSPLAHALTAFAVFATAAATAGLDPSVHLDTLRETLSALCPTWQQGDPSVPNPSPPSAPPLRDDVSSVLTDLVALLSAQDFAGLMDLASEIPGLPALAAAIEEYVGATAPDETGPGDTDPLDPGGVGPGPDTTTDPLDPGTTDPLDPGTTDPGTTDPMDPGPEGTTTVEPAPKKKKKSNALVIGAVVVLAVGSIWAMKAA